MTDQYPSRLLDRFMLRLPDGMREKVADLAKLSGRSMNAEIVKAIEGHIEEAEYALRSAHEVANDLPVPSRVLGTYYVHVDAEGRVSKRVLVSEVEAIEDETGTHAVDIRMITVTPEEERRNPLRAADAAAVRRSRDLVRGEGEGG